MLDWQIRTSFAAGCAGTFIFAWTDEWHRDGEPVDDWEFGLTDRLRHPKPALAAVQAAFAEVPFPTETCWPSVSVIVCSYNGNRTLPQTLDGLTRLDYPDFEVIVVDDGSKQPLAPLVEPYGFRSIRTKNQGLSQARNVGLSAAVGEIVVYLDDDAWPDPHWLQYLASMFMGTDHVAVGGPNVAPKGSDMADCVANAPGGPIHVLISDRVAEHLPGCNLAIRREVLKNLGGFDPQFHVAGDDVDICWRLRQHGSIGFHAGAMVWHRRRDSIGGYWKQQCGYGAAEAMLEKKWPEKYNAPGHVTWEGRIYCQGTSHWFGRVGRIYHGVWGSAPFQRIYQASATGLFSLPMLPEWHLVVLLLAALSTLSILWAPLLIAVPLLIAALGVVVIPACVSAVRASFPSRRTSLVRQLRRRTTTAMLHLMQPVARLWGRLQRGLSPWRKRSSAKVAIPWRRQLRLWRDVWKAPDQRLQSIEDILRQDHPGAFHGGDFDRWDIEVRTGLFGGARMILSTEDYAGGHQLVRVRCWPTISPQAVAVILLLAGLAGWAAVDHAWAACGVLAFATGTLALRMFYEGGTGLGAILGAIEQTGGGET
jgi:GT2 family glycosyltransferase